MNVNITRDQLFSHLLTMLTTPTLEEMTNVSIQFIPHDETRVSSMIQDIDFRMMYPGYDSYLDRMEEKMYNMAVQESINTYKFSEKKPDQLLNISKTLFTQEESGDDICVICQSEFVKDDEISSLQCKHTFHYDCIMECGKYKPECPICRESIPLTCSQPV